MKHKEKEINHTRCQHGYTSSYVETLNLLKANGVDKSQALDCLEFDSDQHPCPDELEEALNIVYGGEQ